MELFVTDHEVARLEAALPRAAGAELAALRLQLAWHLRQRDCTRALDFCKLVQQWAPHLPEPALRQQAQARIALTQAEIHHLRGEPESAEQLAQRAWTIFNGIQDAAGICDAAIMHSMLANDAGRIKERWEWREEAQKIALTIPDPVRADVCENVQVVWLMLQDKNSAMQRWQRRFPQDLSHLPLPVQALAYHVPAFHASLSGDYTQAITNWIKSYHAAVGAGQIRQAIITACNIGDSFNYLNEHQAALEWMQRGLDLARPRGWPSAVGLAMCQCGETLRRLGRLEMASEMLHEALKIQSKSSATRVYASGFAYLADLALDRKEFENALDSFNELLQRSDILRHTDLQIAARRGRAHALMALGQPQLALSSAHEALQLAQQTHDANREIDVLKVLADIHARHELPAPSGMAAPNASLHYLQQACRLGESIAGYTISSDVYDAMGEAWLRAGDEQRAWQSALAACKARDKTQSNEATKRAIALQVQLQTERAMALRAQQAQLAEAEARRAQVLQQTSATLSRLCDIGQDITSQLEFEDVLTSLAQHVQASLEPHALLIFLLDAERRVLTRALLYEEGRNMPARDIPLDDPQADSARCAREKCEILRDWSGVENPPNHIPGSLLTQTSLFAPLMLGERVLGVMSVQSLLVNAFGDHERLIFRTLCAFGAIALDNALTYRQLQHAQQALVAQEKLAALGGLVAGVAHELNTPIGNCLMITSALQDKAYRLQQKIDASQLQRQDLQQFLQDTAQAGDILLRGLSAAAGLVASFKQVAVDRASAQQRRFDLRQTCQETVATMMNQIRIAGHQIEIEIPPHIWMDSYPGPLGQVIAHLIHNAIAHGLDEHGGGVMRLAVEEINEHMVRLVFSDNGRGISPTVLPHVFEAFYSTGSGNSQHAGQTGCGLGLHICHTIISSLLGGGISVSSSPGKGCAFSITLARDVSGQAQEHAR
ncbi:ATP-binding protein [Massilia sp. W12]|uniref:ATP-binding protein n=1 Tax=Massilia sp. W12 TaxID=3126507 RepID=UPI0030CBFEFA